MTSQTMLTRAQEKEIHALRRKSVRDETGQCLVEGQKVIDAAGDAVLSTFTDEDTDRFEWLVTTKSPQGIAGIARIPAFTPEEVLSRDVVVVLDGVQDPGNVGTLLRLCLGFGASMLLVNSADPAGPKVVRSSVGALFHVPWMSVQPDEIPAMVEASGRPVYRLEVHGESVDVASVPKGPLVLIVGSEGSGIHLPVEGTAVHIPHDGALESLNVAHAAAIALYVHATK